MQIYVEIETLQTDMNYKYTADFCVYLLPSRLHKLIHVYYAIYLASIY